MDHYQHLPASPASYQQGCIIPATSYPLKEDRAQERQKIGLDVQWPIAVLQGSQLGCGCRAALPALQDEGNGGREPQLLLGGAVSCLKLGFCCPHQFTTLGNYLLRLCLKLALVISFPKGVVAHPKNAINIWLWI